MPELSALPASFPTEGYSHDVFEQLLQTYVDADGNVDYATWHQSPGDLAALDSYIAAVALYSPENAIERFPSRNDELAYWMYSYNAYVIKAVLDRWPLESVTDVKARIEIVKGFGFFYSQKFLFGKKRYNLYKIENTKIRKNFDDARIHFVLNCASGSCPIIRPELPTGDALEPFLQRATLDFISDTDNVRIDHDANAIVLNEIFDWYKKDFINDLRRRGLPTKGGLASYVESVAPDTLRMELAKVRHYKVTFDTYDWSINKSLGELD